MSARYNRQAFGIFNYKIDWAEGYNAEMYREIYRKQVAADEARGLKEEKLEKPKSKEEAEECTEIKHCPRCGRDLPLTMFGANKTLKDGHACWCKECGCAWNRYQRDKAKAVGDAQSHAPRRSRFGIGSGRPLPCPAKYADGHADDWMFGDKQYKYKDIFI